jgi:hypothetical protein
LLPGKRLQTDSLEQSVLIEIPVAKGYLGLLIWLSRGLPIALLTHFLIAVSTNYLFPEVASSPEQRHNIEDSKKAYYGSHLIYLDLSCAFAIFLETLQYFSSQGQMKSRRFFHLKWIACYLGLILTSFALFLMI